MNLTELETVDELERAIKASHQRPVLLFKHSLTCSISTRAFSELRSHLEHPDPRVDYRLITVQTAREVSDEAASMLKITHQSPQAILVRDGGQVWNASHSSITAKSLDEAIARALGSAE